MFLGFESTDYLQFSPSSISLSNIQTPSKYFLIIKSKLKPKTFLRRVLNNQYTTKNVRRRRKRRNDGILRLAVTDNINVLRARLLAELRRRQQQARQNVQDRLDTIG